MRQPARETTRRESIRPTSQGALLAALHSYAEQADTSYILVAATALERLLEQALLSKMKELSNTLYSDLFTGYGPLASFGAKIDISYALGIVPDELVVDFRAIKAIRNAFAHPDEVLNFSARQLDRLFQKLTGWRRGADRRALFDERVLACTKALNRYTETAIFVQALQGREKPTPSRR
jgi:DNA-binding MltR family transcriptional regulator